MRRARAREEMPPGERAALAFAGVLLLAAALACPAPARGAVPEPAGGARPFRSGEQLTYQLRWFGIPVIKTHLTVSGPLEWEGRRVLRYEARIKSLGLLHRLYPIRDRVRSYADALTLRAYRMDVYQREGSYRNHRWYAFGADAVTYGKKTGRPKRYETPGGALDALSALYWLRTTRLRPGQTVEVPVFGRRRRLRIRMRMTRTEWLDSLWGPVKTYRVEPRVLGKRNERLRKAATTWIWVTADENLIPLRMESRTFIGPIVAHLTETHRVASGPLSRPPLRKLSRWKASTKIVSEKRAAVLKKMRDILGKVK